MTTVISDDDSDDVIVQRDTSFDLLNCTPDIIADIDDDNYIVDVKVKWKSQPTIARLELRRVRSRKKFGNYTLEIGKYLFN